MKILRMTLHREWFLLILRGKKKEEYREIKPYWTKRLAKEYDAIEFKNGYSSDAMSMIVKYRGYEVKEILHPITNKMETVYCLKLGKILSKKNIKKRAEIRT